MPCKPSFGKTQKEKLVKAYDLVESAIDAQFMGTKS